MKFKNFCIALFLGSYVHAATITWIALDPSNDMEDAANWSPNVVPGSGDVAVFDSSLSGVVTNPTESSNTFSVSAFNFPTLASPFLFTFNNQSLAFSGLGITGAHTNPSLSFSNINNSTLLNDLLSFASAASMGSATISITNNATLTGAQSGQSIGILNSHIHSAGAFTIADGGTMSITSVGHDSTTALGGNSVAVNNASQLKFDNSFTSGSNVTISVENNGICDGSSSANINQTAYLNDNQFFVGQTVQAGDNFNLSVSNSGNDSSTGVGQNQVAVINSNSGTTGDQLLFFQGAALSNNAAVSVTNNGTYSGSNTVGGSQVGGMNQGQCTVGDSTSIGSYNFSAQDNFNLTVSNNGTDNATGTGGDAIGAVSTNQAAFFTPCVLGDQAAITINNEGHYTGSASTSYVNIGSVGGHQFTAASTFQAGDDFTLHITNLGENEGSGIGGFFIGDVITAQQADFEQGLTLGNNGTITVTNSGSNAASTTNNNQVGSMMGYGKQLLVKQNFNAGDNLTLTIRNSGVDNSTGGGNNFVGFINNNTADGTGSQVHLADGATWGDNASITVSNNATFAGNNDGNFIATLAGGQWACEANFQAGNQLNFNVSMNGTNNASGQNNNNIGSGGTQVDFGSDCSLGNEASFIIANNGINHDASGTNNVIGYVSNHQMNVAGDFSAGTDLNIHVSNSATNAGDITNLVGTIVNYQLAFQQGCTLGDGAAIKVVNTGTVGASQILFNQGFTVSSGKITINAINSGTVTNHGIEINGNNAGGNAEITLNNSSLYIAALGADFTIGGLAGDALSTAQSQPTLIINRDNSAQTTFAGSIQDFSDIIPTFLVKTGAGTQILSGANSYTGLTTIQEGVLAINGSLVGDVIIDSAGTLKGSGTINGTVTNAGTIAPGQSIGAITVGSYVNNGATYEVEVNGAGQSDLIHALSTATINGGTVTVIAQDFKFNAPQTYTILTADAGVTGQFALLTSTVPSLMRLSYDPFNVQLTYMPLVTDAGLSCNAVNAARCFTTLTNADAMAIKNTLFTLNVEALNDAFEQMSPALLSNLSAVQLFSGILVRSTYSKRLQSWTLAREQCSQHPFNMWSDGFAQWQKQKDPFGYRDRTLGTTIGADYAQCCWTFGGALSFTHDDLQWTQDGGTAAINSYYGGLYSQLKVKKFFFDAALIGAFNDYSSTRHIDFATVNRYAYSRHHGSELLIHGDVQYQASLSHYQLTPYLNLDGVFLYERGHTQVGAESLDLCVQPKNSILFQTEAGLSLSATYHACKSVFVPSLSISYINQTPCSNRNYQARFVDSPCVLSSIGENNRQNLFSTQVAFIYQSLHDRFKASIYYDGQVNNSYWAQDMVLDFAVRF